MSGDSLMDASAFDPRGPAVVYELFTWTQPRSAVSSRTHCTLRDDGTLKVELENLYGVPMGAAIFDRAGWEALIREVDRVWKA